MIAYYENEGPLNVDTIEMAHDCAKSTLRDSDLDTIQYCVIDFDKQISTVYIMEKTVSFSITAC